jgi:hypothetical protein
MDAVMTLAESQSNARWVNGLIQRMAAAADAGGGIEGAMAGALGEGGMPGGAVPGMEQALMEAIQGEMGGMPPGGGGPLPEEMMMPPGMDAGMPMGPPPGMPMGPPPGIGGPPPMPIGTDVLDGVVPTGERRRRDQFREEEMRGAY